MLMTLGPVQFEVVPFNTDGYSHEHETAWVEKPVLGVRPPLEWVGDGAESWTISAKLFPGRFGGLGSLRTLYQARAAGQPQYLMRGDGAQMGWVVIERVSEQSTHLDGKGVGQMIEVEITVKRASAPGSGGYYAALAGLF